MSSDICSRDCAQASRTAAPHSFLLPDQQDSSEGAPTTNNFTMSKDHVEGGEVCAIKRGLKRKSECLSDALCKDDDNAIVSSLLEMINDGEMSAHDYLCGDMDATRFSSSTPRDTRDPNSFRAPSPPHGVS